MALAPILPTALSIGLLLGAVPASAGSANRYQEYDQGAYLPYVNAPGPNADIIASPLLRVSFGGRSYAAVMDTGSTGVVVSADKIPNIASLQSLGPGQLTYSSFDQWVADLGPPKISPRNQDKSASGRQSAFLCPSYARL